MTRIILTGGMKRRQQGVERELCRGLRKPGGNPGHQSWRRAVTTHTDGSVAPAMEGKRLKTRCSECGDVQLGWPNPHRCGKCKSNKHRQVVPGQQG